VTDLVLIRDAISSHVLRNEQRQNASGSRPDFRSRRGDLRKEPLQDSPVELPGAKSKDDLYSAFVKALADPGWFQFLSGLPSSDWTSHTGC
jgi:hypothetical protein